MGEPDHVEWYARGRRARRQEVVKSIEEGIPALLSTTLREDGLKILDEMRKRFEQFIPAE